MALTMVDGNKDYWQYTWLQFKDGDKAAFAIFYNLHIDPLFQYGLKFSKDEDTVKDAIQELFIELYLKRQKSNTSPETLRYYLFLALKRNLIKKLKNKRKFDLGELADSSSSDLELSPEYRMIEMEQNEESRHKIAVAISQLTDKQKEVVYLRFNEAMDYPEIANLMGISIESVRKQVYRAIKLIRELLDNKTFTVLFYFFCKKK